MYVINLQLCSLLILFSSVAVRGMEQHESAREVSVYCNLVKKITHASFKYLEKNTQGFGETSEAKLAAGIRVIVQCGTAPEQDVKSLFDSMKRALKSYGVKFKSDKPKMQYTVTIPDADYKKLVTNCIENYSWLRKKTFVYLMQSKDGDTKSIMLVAELATSTKARL